MANRLMPDRSAFINEQFSILIHIRVGVNFEKLCVLPLRKIFPQHDAIYEFAVFAALFPRFSTAGRIDRIRVFAVFVRR